MAALHGWRLKRFGLACFENLWLVMPDQIKMRNEWVSEWVCSRIQVGLQRWLVERNSYGSFKCIPIAGPICVWGHNVDCGVWINWKVVCKMILLTWGYESNRKRLRSYTCSAEDDADSKMVCNIDLCKIRPSVIQIWQIEQKITIPNSRLLFRMTLVGRWVLSIAAHEWISRVL